LRALLLGALALTLAACGSSSDDKSASSNNDPCARPAGFHPVRDELPAGVAPGGTFVGEVQRKGGTTSGELFFTGGVSDTYQTLKAGTESHGYQLTADDQEGFEAEVEGTRPGEELRFKVEEIQGCSSAARGNFTRVKERD
jgi:hypothetical protein